MDLRRTEIKIIPHKAQRYDTVGDWIFSGEALLVTVSDMKNNHYHFLVSVHEQIEAMLCAKAGIKEEDVTNFDMQFEQWRDVGQVGEFDEPGNDPRAPYYIQHKLATKIEMELADILGVNWNEYDLAVNSL